MTPRTSNTITCMISLRSRPIASIPYMTQNSAAPVSTKPVQSSGRRVASFWLSKNSVLPWRQPAWRLCAGAEPLPYLFICAFVANAASFVLPISNPANLVIYGSHMPPLMQWLVQFAWPSVMSIGITYLMLRITQRRVLATEKITREVKRPRLSPAGRLTGCGIAATGVALLLCSTFDLKLGLPTLICGCASAVIVLLVRREAPWPILAGISWGILPLLAGLFVLSRTGVIAMLYRIVQAASDASASAIAWAAGVLIALGCNLMNNLPAGLIAGYVISADQLRAPVTGAALIAVDLGPNLSVTGSLATILSGRPGS
jgi:arsenical pump membrane protein